MSDHFPHEVFIEILLRLPLKTLAQCTCVCKSWNSFITNPSFIATHLNRTTTTDLLLLMHYSEYNRTQRYSLLLDNETLNEYRELEVLFKPVSGSYFRVVGSCNGLLCLSDDLMGYTDVVILWNPSIGKCVTLPSPRITYHTHGPYKCALGFGFDGTSDDYKVVRIFYAQTEFSYIPCPLVEVYLLSTGAWRGISADSPPYCIADRTWSQAFMNGAVHWVGYHSRIPDENLILTFDVGDEVFGEMMLPTNLVCQWDTTIAVCRGMLSVFQYDEHSGIYSSSYRCSIWVMNEYGVAESWTKQFSIDTQEGIWDTIGVWQTIGLRQAIRKIISLRKDGEILLQTSDGVRGKLVSYNPETKRINVIGICSGTRDSFHVDTYMESPVLLKGVNGVLGSQAEPDAVTPVLLGGNDGVERTKETVEGKEE